MLFAPILVLMIGGARCGRVSMYAGWPRPDSGPASFVVWVGPRSSLGVGRAERGCRRASPQFALIRSPLLTPLALGLGTLLVVIGWLLATSRTESAPRPFAAAERASLFVAAAMMLMALFWLTNIFATLYGEHEAKSIGAAVGPGRRCRGHHRPAQPARQPHCGNAPDIRWVTRRRRPMRQRRSRIGTSASVRWFIRTSGSWSPRNGRPNTDTRS